MSKENETIKTSNEYEAPKGNISEHSIKIKNKKLNYVAQAEWLLLRKNEKPIAEMFHTAYFIADEISAQKNSSNNKKRPLTFVFNGGPGAASAYLHVGALGPKRVPFEKNGNLPKPPISLMDNNETWLEFTDLVFVDPIGTGFSRTINEQTSALNTDKGNEKKDSENLEFYAFERDLESLCEFIKNFLSKHNRWTSPIYIAGESYGGYRVAKLAKKLQQGYGVALSGAIIISPALEMNLLSPIDYDINSWVDLFPTYVASSFENNITKYFSKKLPIEKVVLEAEQFAINELSKILYMGNSVNSKDKKRVFKTMADMLGVSEEYVELKNGKILIHDFSEIVMKNENKVLGMYDATILGTNPFPDRKYSEHPDPTLHGLGMTFTAGINSLLRDVLGIKTEREYHLLNMKVNESWKVDIKKHALETNIGSMDDLRYGIALNAHMKVFICHGYFDLVTPFFSSKRLMNHIVLDEKSSQNIQFKVYKGGHMFYSWDESRVKFTTDIEKMYKK